MNRLLLAFCLAWIVATPANAQLLFLTHGKIVTLDADSRIAEALVIKDGLIARVGSDADLRAALPAGAREIDLGGRTLIPGLIDSHIHAIRAGLTFSKEVNWIGATSLREALARMRDVAARTPDDAWVVVPGGWNAQQFAEKRAPTQAEIEAAAPRHPVYVQMSYVGALLSTRGFAALGVSRDEDLPANGRMERDREGRMTGWVQGDLQTIVALYDRLPKPTLEDAMKGTRAFFHELNRLGVTGVSDPQGHNLALDQYDAVERLARDGALTVRVRLSHCAPRPGFELEDYERLTDSLRAGDDWLRANGIGECVTWGMYNNDNPSAAQLAQFEAVALFAARHKLGLTIHWNNDGSVHHLLDAFERVLKQVDYAPLRWSIAHVHDASPQTLARMRALHLGWLMQDRLYFAAPAFLSAYAQSRIERLPPLVTALQLGLPVGGGTDADRVMSYSPFVALRWMLDGRTISGLETRTPAEIPSREQALRIWTQGSAWFTHEDDRRGVLSPGAVADLAVLSADVLTMPLADFSEVTSLLTIVGGKIVFADGPFATLLPH
ncbi:MAG: TIM-barrel fold metal-dependent hydrolase [Hyphomicrobiales bacterium]|nr:TIM-barrel fold metal-dependent hydrolase [Hyphomicrobiales bacterium]